jgi:glycosyltransferase involved in cell wall biosynthesis
LETAITHHWLNGMRGGEKVLEYLCRLYSNADIFTLFYDQEKTSEIINSHKVYSSFLNRYKFFKKNYNQLFPLFPFLTEQFDLSKYDLVITSDTLSMKGVITRPDTCHICYCHTPPRYVWDLYFDYLDNSDFGKLKNIIARLFLHQFRKWDSIASSRVDYFIANSRFVAKRISKFYRRTSEVINPPINIREFQIADGGDYYLTLGQLVPYKRIDLLIDSFNKMPDRKLIIAGSGPNEKTLRKNAKPNITFTGKVNESDKVKLYQGCRAFLFPGIEDYGITPLEAQACGKPVIATGRGGILDTVKGLYVEDKLNVNLENKTGLFFKKQCSDSIISAIEYFEKIEKQFSSELIREHAEKFDEKFFMDKIRFFIEEKKREFDLNGPPIT